MKRALILLTTIVCIIAIFTACGKKKVQYSEYVTDANGEYVTDKDGNKETTIIDEKNVSVEYVTDKDGKKTIDENGKYVTVLHVNRDVTVTDKDGKTVTEKNGKAVTSKQETAETTVGIGDVEGQTSVQPETTVAAGKTTKTSEHLFETKVMPILKSGTFTMKMTFTGDLEGTGNVAMPAVIAYDTPNNRFYMETSMGITKLQCIVKNNKMYLLMPTLKSYSETDYSDADGEMGEAMKEITNNLSSSAATYSNTTKVKYKGVDCICEEYKDGSATYRYFFRSSDKQLVRMEVIDGDSGQNTIINIDYFAAGAQDSYFNIPKGYRKMDLESIANALGS